jgi:PKD repeat protein
MKKRNLIYTVLFTLILTTVTAQAQEIVGYSGLFTFNTVGAQLSADFTIDTTDFTVKNISKSQNTFVFDVASEIQFLDRSEGPSLPNKWSWDFGDGSPVSTLQNPTHFYTTPGNYSVKLTIQNSAGINDFELKTDFIILNSHNNGIELKIVETGNQGIVKWVGYQYRNQFRILKTVDDIPVQDHQASISWDSKFFLQNDFNDEIILYGEVGGNKKQIGHIKFEYEHSIEKENIRNAILIFHNDSELDSHFPYGPGKLEYDNNWNYYEVGEYPVTMLIPPDNTFPIAFDKQPLLFVHGWGGTYSYKKDPDALPSANEVSYWFTTVKKVNELGDFQAWQFYYPYDTDILTLGECLKSAIGNLKLKYPPASTIGIVTHSMGGLVTSEYITSNPADAKSKVFKVLYSVPPIHGSLGANKHYKKNTGSAVELFTGKDSEAPAPRDMALGSEFMWNLHSRSWVNLNGENNSTVMDDYFVLLGSTKKFFGIAGSLHNEAGNHNDGIVSISSGSLTDKQVGFATFHGNHDDGAHMQSKKRYDPTKQNIGNPILLPQIVKAFFTENHTDFLNSIKSLPEIKTVVDGNRHIEKPVNLGWETINSNPEVDFKKGILNLRIAQQDIFGELVPNFLFTYYNSQSSKMIISHGYQNLQDYLFIGFFLKNDNNTSDLSYFFSEVDILLSESTIQFVQGENHITIKDLNGQAIIHNLPVTLNYSETKMETISLSKNKEIDLYLDQTDLKKDSIIVSGNNQPGIINTGFCISAQDTLVRFVCRIISDSASGIQMKLKTPDGIVVDSTYMDGLYSFSPDLLEYSMIISDPTPGKWFVWAESDAPILVNRDYESIAYLQSGVHAFGANTNENAVKGKNFQIRAGLQMETPGLSDSLIVKATVYKQSGFSQEIDISANPIQTDSGYIFQYNYPIDSAGYYLVKFNYEGVYNDYRFERALWQQFVAIDTIPFLNVPDVILRQLESQKTFELSQYLYNVEEYDTLYFSSNIISSNLDSTEFSVTIDSLALSAYLITNLADTGTVRMQFNCHFDDHVVSDIIDVSVLLSDLFIENAQLSDTIISNASSFVIGYDITNSGNFDAGEYNVRYYISEDSLIQPSDYCLGSKTILHQSTGIDLPVSDTINLPFLDLAGSFYLLVKADATDKITEIDETNNLTIIQVYLNQPPAPPVILFASPGDSIVQLKWTSNLQQSISGYAIHYGLDSTAVLNKVYSLSPDTTFTVSGLTNESTYYFAVSAFKMMGNESGLSSFLAATPSVFTNQHLQMSQGWSGISITINTLDANVETMFAPIIADLIILQNASGIFWPGQNINTLGVWNTHEGYQVKVADNVELTISGTRENDRTVQLAYGWNLIPVLSECNADVADLFNGTNITIVKEVAGWNIYWPEFGINTLEVLEPGKAYFVLMDGEGSVTYPDCTFKDLMLTGESTQTGLHPNLSESIDLSEFSTNPTPNTHIIAIPTSAIQNSSIQNGDIISAFDEIGNCFGFVLWSSKNASITLFGDDLTTLVKDGFVDGNQPNYKLFRPSSGEEFVLELSYENRFDHSGLFRTKGMSVVKDLKTSAVGMEALGFSELRIYPNPGTGIFNFEGLKGEATISIFNAFGEIVKQIEMKGWGQINLSSHSKGVYFIKIESEARNHFEKLIIQ